MNQTTTGLERLMSSNYTLHYIVIAVVMICWLVFALVFVLRKKPRSSPAQKRDRSSIIGIAIQALAFLVVWFRQRPLASDLLPWGKVVEIVFGVIAIGLAICSVWMALAAVKALSRHWSLSAKLVEGHKLVTTGPYQLVRHPIYAGMFGLMLATALALSHWDAIILAIVLFFIGAVIRVKSEEKLLAETFRQEFLEYTQKVPMLLPRLFRSTGFTKRV